VLVMTRPGVDIDLPRGILIPLQLLLCLVLADLSYRFVELPFNGKAKVPRMPDGWLRIARPALLVSVLGVILIVGWSGIVKAGGSNPEQAAASTATSAHVSAKPQPQPDPRPTKGAAPKNGKAGAKEGAGSKKQTHQATTKHWPRIVMLGDSVMIGAEEKLAARLGPGFSMDAKVGRQADEFLAIIAKIKRDGHHPDAMVIQWGNNGPLYSEDMEALRKDTTNVKQLFLISDHAPVSWQDESNHAIAEASEDWHHTTEIPWAKTAEEGGEGLFWDGIHLTPEGAGIYARLVTKVLHEKLAFPAG
jgi:lysophospholipase L1-like esterase